LRRVSYQQLCSEAEREGSDHQEEREQKGWLDAGPYKTRRREKRREKGRLVKRNKHIDR
jgi:hypothetical protein